MNVYETKTMAERLNGNTYPGRGIVLGITPTVRRLSLLTSSWAAPSTPGTVGSAWSPTASAPRLTIPL